LLPHHALKVFGCYFEQCAQLFDALIRDVTGGIGRDCLIEEFLGLLMVGPRNVQRVFESGFVLKG
jgi:hypothetical protein